MTEENDASNGADHLTLPSGLREGLARAAGPTVRIPPAMDAKILNEAKRAYARRSRWRGVAWRVGIAGGLAAAVLVVLMLAGVFHHHTRSAVAKAGDINGDGHIDILDAYIVAHRLSTGAKTPPTWDVNGDGIVDQRDVDWIAASAVRISPPAGSATGEGGKAP